MPNRKEIERIKNLGLKKSYIIKNTVENLQKKLHLTQSQINRTFPDLISALKREARDNMQRNIIIIQVKTIRRFKY